MLRPLGTLDPADLQKKRVWKQIYGLLLERPNLAGAAGLHFTSVQEAKISERFGTHPPDLVLPLGVTSPLPVPQGLARRQFDIPANSPLVLFMSRIDPKKGLALLIAALERLLAAGLKFHFVLAGANPQDPAYEKQIIDQIKASPLASCTAIAGFVTGS